MDVTDHSGYLSVSPGVLARSACRALQILSLFFSSAHGRGGIRMISNASVTSTLQLAPAALLLTPTLPGTVTYITRSAAIQNARGIHLAPRLVYPVVRHIRLAPKAFNIAHPRFRASKAYVWYSTAPWIFQPDRYSQKLSARLGCPVRSTIGKLPTALRLY